MVKLFNLKTLNGKTIQYIYEAESGCTYIDHSTRDSGTSKTVARNVTDRIRETESKDTLQGVLADGANVNTAGWRNGAIVEVRGTLRLKTSSG